MCFRLNQPIKQTILCSQTAITEFKQLVDEFSKVIQSVSKEVESSKMDAFTSKNELKSFEDAIEREKQNLREQISLRKARLEQLKTENRLLEEEEQSQAEFMSKFIAQS